MGKCAFFITNLLFLTSALAEVKPPEFSCMQDRVEVNCYNCEIQARGTNITPKQITEIVNKINAKQIPGSEAKIKIDSIMRDKLIRLKLESLYDIATNGLYSWPGLSQKVFLPRGICTDQPEPGKSTYREFYSASKQAAEQTILLKAENQKDAEQESIFQSRLKVLEEAGPQLNIIADLRKEVARMELKFGDENLIKEKKEKLKKLEKEFLSKGYLLQAPELFRPLTVLDIKADSIKNNRSVGAFAPNSLFEGIEKILAKEGFEISIPNIKTHGQLVDENIKRIILNNKKELKNLFKQHYDQAFLDVHKEVKELCSSASAPEIYYQNKNFVTWAAGEVLKKKEASRDQVMGAYKVMCEIVDAKARVQDWALSIEEHSDSRLATGAGMLGFLIPVAGWGGSMALKIPKVASVMLGTISRAEKIALLGYGAAMTAEMGGAAFAASRVTRALGGMGSSTYDLELKNLTLLIQMAKHADANEADKLKAEIAEQVLRLEQSQIRQSENFKDNLWAISAVALTRLSIIGFMNKYNDVESLVKIKAAVASYHRGVLTERQFLETLYRIQTKNFKGEIVKADFDKWLESTKVSSALRTLEEAHLEKNAIEYAAKVKEDLSGYKLIKNSDVNDIYLGLLKYDSKGIGAANKLFENIQNNTKLRPSEKIKEFSELRSVILSAANSPIKQKYLVEFSKAGKLSKADKVLLKTWSDPDAIGLMMNIRIKAVQNVVNNAAFKGNFQKALDSALKENLGAEGFYNLCVKGGCPVCVAK